MTTIKIEIIIQASPSEVYYYFTNSTALRDWICDIATTDPRPGGHLYLCWPGNYYTSGEYLQLEKDKSVSFTWLGRGEPHKTRVDVTLKKQKSGTLVKLAHREIGTGQIWDEIAKGYEREWQSALENLASVVGSGPDLRITRRPMLGIYLSDYDAAIAAKLGVPVEFGSRLDGVIDGMGAQKAGLQKDDVITAIDAHELVSGTTLASVMDSKHAGDIVDVTFYRGPDKKSVKMTLSGRLIPHIPASSMELSEQIAVSYRQNETEIDNIINNASEAECSHKPAAIEWSAKDVLAHLIHSELGWQNYASEIIGGHEPSYDDFGGNIQARIDATVDIFPTKAELIKALKNHDAETVRMLAHIPVDFLSHKGRFWKIAYQANQNSYHLQNHLEQMRLAIQSAKKNKPMT
jgi:uncharacterized protein YndB with AHSA1/START domain